MYVAALTAASTINAEKDNGSHGKAYISAKKTNKCVNASWRVESQTDKYAKERALQQSVRQSESTISHRQTYRRTHRDENYVHQDTNSAAWVENEHTQIIWKTESNALQL